MVRVRSQSTAVLECEVEAFPEPTISWEREDGGRLKMSDKYRMEVYDKRDTYKVIHDNIVYDNIVISFRYFQLKMRLKITKITLADHGTYYCVVKNDIDITKGSFIVDG